MNVSTVADSDPNRRVFAGRLPCPTCPHCHCGQANRHGTFRRKDGTCEQRYLCRNCKKSFNRCTSTPIHYIKKRDRWGKLADVMVRVLTVRQAAGTLGVTATTAFRWRHRLLGALRDRPASKHAGCVAVAEAYVPYSEKGARCPGPRPRRNLFERKPSCVLLLDGEAGQAAVIASRGRPRVEDLTLVLTQLVATGAELWSSGLGPYDQACRAAGLKRSQISEQHGIQRFWPVESLRRGLFGWLGRFQGVATRYLENYLNWFVFARRTKKLLPAPAAALLLMEVKSPGMLAA